MNQRNHNLITVQTRLHCSVICSLPAYSKYKNENISGDDDAEDRCGGHDEGE